LKLSGNLSKYLYLEETVVSQRLDMISQDIERERQIVEIENKINKDVKKYIADSQEEYYLR
jgi:ATP-dependent Lon protease